jgi:methylated-DNA-[protein]-cysteine S-methyltransferase
MMATELDARSIGRRLRAGSGEGASAVARGLAERADEAGLLDVAYATAETPMGTAIVAATSRGLVRVGLPNEAADTVLDQLAREVSPRVLEWRGRLDEVLRELDEYFEGRRDRFELSLDRRLTTAPFARNVLRETARIPFGVTSTYSLIAAKAGNPRASRAAGNALGSNPIPIVVPCHRVLRTGGAIGGYGGGPEMKEFLLRLEGAII